MSGVTQVNGQEMSLLGYLNDMQHVVEDWPEIDDPEPETVELCAMNDSGQTSFPGVTRPVR